MVPVSVDHVENKATVIVGAGSIGLWIAYYLAATRSQTTPSSNETIIVLEAADAPFNATSATCTGCLHYGFDDEDLIKLGKYSFALWEDLVQNDEFRDIVGLRFSSIFGVKEANGENLNLLPDWLRTSNPWRVNNDFLGSKNAMVNPSGVGKWLTQACNDLGVQIWTSTTVTSVELDKDNRATAVIGTRQDQSQVRFPCADFILAGGPWTPSVYGKLFPSSTVHLESSMDAGDWIVFQNPLPTVERSVAFVGLNDVVGEKLEFAGRSDGTIWVCGARDHNGNLPPVGTTGQANVNKIAELTGRAYRFLKVQNADNPGTFEELQVVSLGRAFRPTTLSGRPIMSTVAPDRLSRDGNPGDASGNVFLCWGHGSYGLTLGPGTGKLMSQLIQGQSPDLDLSPFQIPSNL